MIYLIFIFQSIEGDLITLPRALLKDQGHVAQAMPARNLLPPSPYTASKISQEQTKKWAAHSATPP